MKFKLIAIVFILIIYSCDSDNSSLMPSITGKTGELVLVIENSLWESEPGDSLRTILQADCPGIIPEETMFEVIHIPGSSFVKLYQTHRNIIRIKVSDSFKDNKVLVKKNVWAQPQSVIEIKVKNKKDLLTVIEKNKDKLVDVFLKAEMGRATSNNKKFEEHTITNRLIRNHKLSMYFPKGYVTSMDSSNFVWISQTLREAELGVLAYYYDYKDTSAFSPQALINKRDSILKTKVHGSIEGSYMQTDREFPIDYKEINFNGNYAVEIRGWWETTGKQFWGGPFYSLTTVDEKRNRIVTVEGFVFAPNKKKRDYIRRLKSIIHTLKFD